MAFLVVALFSVLALVVASSSPLPSTVIFKAASEVSPAAERLQRSLDAMGGEAALRALRGVTYRTPR
jgi:hypothetical protein